MPRLVTGLLLAVVLHPLAALAQAYPARPVHLIISFPPGGPTDIAARLIATKASEGLGQPLLVDNRAGGGGTIAAAAVVKAAPDGYTLLLTPVSTHFISYFVLRAKPYDPIADFTPICSATDGSTGIAVTNALPVKSIPELIDLAKREPGKLTYSSAGIGTLFHLTGELFKQAAGVNILHVPYKGAGQALVDLQSGQISMTFSILAPLVTYVRSGKVRLIAVMDEARYRGYPDVPTVAETLPGFKKLGGSLGFFGPAGLPRPIVQRANAEIARAVLAPEVRPKLEDFGFRVFASTPEEFAASLKTSYEVFEKAVRGAGIKPD
ncbi:MAG: tripartite tricarboxylate transporter substrate binding protein [Burkholderiales bacterium]|nr:tripartite tricarboxylate transporter substrate binding protein [Burkholderiales bacterium]